MSKVKEPEIITVEDNDIEESNIKQPDVVDLAQSIAENVAEQLATAPSNAGELVEAIEVTVEPIVVYKVTTRLPLR
ncbi:protein of unknown function [Pseudodesulfovibrio profundus]|uniref:Uncharacterized protein n=1 Tax=Pseudodesulfovibrio profundus TaxID=57320 RepID=A0A2C8F876_9BACT|nr:hypothetical protein [Pseudodesulfovibrio profundus]SOB58952.1 protein of unknown function [Pseudodesulfovibrio profundus]